MSFEIEITKRFEKELKKLCKKYTSLKSEYKELIEKLANDPKTGTALGNNLFNIRISISSKQKGKSGGARVITHFLLMQIPSICFQFMTNRKNQLSANWKSTRF